MGIYEELVSAAGEENVKREEPLSEHTSFRIGGPARFFVTPADIGSLEKVLQCVREQHVDHFIMGNGSNLLVRDTGFDGVMISTCKRGAKGQMDGLLGLRDHHELSEEEFMSLGEQWTGTDLHALLNEAEGKRMVLSGSGVMLSAFANGLADQGLTGFEFASGIPGSLGGAVAMNAGAYGGEIKDCILGAEVLTRQHQGEGEVFKKQFLTKEELLLGYRSSRVQKECMIVLRALFAFSEGDKEQIKSTMNEFNERRREKQPLNFGSAGSTFKRPEGHFAGKLIEDAGLKGYRVGDVMVSEKHAGFVVNVGNGTYEQAMVVIRHVQETVQEKFGVSLETEVKFVE